MIGRKEEEKNGEVDSVYQNQVMTMNMATKFFCGLNRASDHVFSGLVFENAECF